MQTNVNAIFVVMTDSPAVQNILQPECRIAEILQHTCNIELDDSGNKRINCFPLPRVFLLYCLFRIFNRRWLIIVPSSCPKQPTAEVTRHVNINVNTGQVELPRELRYEFF